MRLIDADALQVEYKQYHDGKRSLLIDTAPTIEPRPRGEWVYNSPVTMKCDLCGFVIKDWDWHRFNFCPNCGADMRQREEEQDE